MVDSNPDRKKVLRQQHIRNMVAKRNRSTVNMYVQYFEERRGVAGDLVVFPIRAPEQVDMLKLAPFPVLRHCTRVWHSGASEEPGCLAFHSPTFARPSCEVGEEGAPTLLLLDALHSEGWIRGRPHYPHRSDEDASTRRLYCIDQCISRRHYLQCLLRLSELFARGLCELSCVAPQTYYQCLLRLEGDLSSVAAGRPAAEYTALWRKRPIP